MAVPFWPHQTHFIAKLGEEKLSIQNNSHVVSVVYCSIGWFAGSVCLSLRSSAAPCHTFRCKLRITVNMSLSSARRKLQIVNIAFVTFPQNMEAVPYIVAPPFSV